MSERSSDFDSCGEQLRARHLQVNLASEGIAIERLWALKLNSLGSDQGSSEAPKSERYLPA